MPSNPFILIAEDDIFFGTILKVGLTEENFDVLVVKNGEDAMKAMRARRPDLLVLDLVLPIKDGFEVIKEVEADAKLKGTKIMIFTNLAQEEDRDRASELGVHDFFLKASISIADVVKKIKEIVAR